ncbi:OmpA family protein [Lacihabitans soyangensis]|nr:OmpA family protein [Lacihabitans soyangensis]
MRFLLLIFCGLCLNQVSAQNQAFYYFDKGFDEFSGNFPALGIEGDKGEFLEEVVEKFGKEKRKVYRFPKSSGLVFDNTKIKNFINGSYGIEMYFRYDDGSMLLYGQLLGDQLISSQGKYVHLVTTRNVQTKQMNVFVNGKLTLNFSDTGNNLEIDDKSQVSFFSQEGTPTTAGAVAMIKLYDFFIDEKNASNLFQIFSEQNNIVGFNPKGILKNLYFLKSQDVILPESIPELENIFAFLENNPKAKIELQGHTDNQGDFNLNLTLSRNRTLAVKNFLVKKGIDDKRISTRGFGSTKPIASNESEETRRKNRRVELIVL